MAFELSTFHLQGVYAFYAFAASLSPIQRGAVREMVLGLVMLHIQLNQMLGGSRMRGQFPGLVRIVVMRGVFRRILKLGWGRLNADGEMDFEEGERRFVRTIVEREGGGIEIVFSGQ
jgi:hypothetical protein